MALGGVGTAVASAQAAEPCDDVDELHVIALEPEAGEDVAETVEDPVEDEQYCTVEERLAGILGVEEGDQLRLWGRTEAPNEAGSGSLFTVGSVADDRLARVRANPADLEAVGIVPRGVAKVSAETAAACFDDEE